MNDESFFVGEIGPSPKKRYSQKDLADWTYLGWGKVDRYQRLAGAGYLRQNMMMELDLRPDGETPDLGVR